MIKHRGYGRLKSRLRGVWTFASIISYYVAG